MESSCLDKHGSKTLQHKESWPFWNVPCVLIHMHIELRKKKYFFYGGGDAGSYIFNSSKLRIPFKNILG
jgi:hypothetical protein